jgi:hypothetical protein
VSLGLGHPKAEADRFLLQIDDTSLPPWPDRSSPADLPSEHIIKKSKLSAYNLGRVAAFHSSSYLLQGMDILLELSLLLFE